MTVDTLKAKEHNSVDKTLIAEFLALTPLERLEQNDRSIKTIKELQSAFSKHRESKAKDSQ